MQATQAPQLLTVPEFAAALRVHPASIYRRIQSGEIDYIRLGHRLAGGCASERSSLPAF
jgi:excisionase family DNA binding protein